jgi:tripartite-type tricarboxylate transporter receptor subunit TctC
MGGAMKRTERTGRKRRWPGRIVVLAFFLFFLGQAVPGVSHSAPANFPEKEITTVVSYGPGGSMDILARGLSNTMRKYLGVPLVVMNMPGAGGGRGRSFIYNAAPDGYTIGVNAPDAIAQEIFEKTDFENRKFSYIGNAQVMPLVFCVKPDSQIRSMKDFKALGKRVRTGTFSMYTGAFLASIIMATREGWPLSMVGGYKGGGDAALGLIRGDIDFCAIPLTVASSFIKSGQIRPIMLLDRKRHPNFPDIPVIGEEGYPDLVVLGGMQWLMAPPGVAKARIQMLEDSLKKTLEDPEFLKWAEGANVDVLFMNGEETKQMVLKMFSLLEQYKKEIQKYNEK